MPVPAKARKSMASYKASRKVTPIMRTNQLIRRSIPAAIGRGLNRRGVASKESGYVDLAYASYPCNTTGSITLIATIAQGASVNQRVGKKVALKSLQIRGVAINDTAATVNDVAVIIVYDRRPTGSLPAITDVLDTANAASFNNDSNSGRFKIIKRMDFVLTGNSTTPATGNEAMNLDCFIPLNGLPAVFKAAGTGAIGDIEEGALYCITVGTNAAGTADANAGMGFRTRFVDN